MYSYENRIRAVEFYSKLGKRVKPTIRQLGYQLIEQQISLYIFWSDFMPSNESVYQVVLDHHGPIVEAILAGNSETASRLAAEHNIDAGLKLVRHLAQLEAERAKAA